MAVVGREARLRGGAFGWRSDSCVCGGSVFAGGRGAAFGGARATDAVAFGARGDGVATGLGRRGEGSAGPKRGGFPRGSEWAEVSRHFGPRECGETGCSLI